MLVDFFVRGSDVIISHPIYFLSTTKERHDSPMNIFGLTIASIYNVITTDFATLMAATHRNRIRLNDRQVLMKRKLTAVFTNITQQKSAGSLY